MNKKVVIIEDGQVSTTFEDVAGLDEAKEELEEIVDYLKVPLKYAFAGAKIPKGVLLDGPPGTGKTLLARAVAGEAGVSFISASGSEFIEMFVGVGAQRVRNLFEQAKQNKPCVIFIDEIDAIGGKRGYGFNSGGNDEREQTLNQILTNMDGFDKDEGIIVLAATNRADTLDPALKRSGRFDRKVQVPLPDLVGRKEIAKVHFKNKPNVSVDYDNLARLTQGFSGADLATLANEAALLGVRNNLTIIDNNLVQRAFEKMTIGLPKKSDLRSPETKQIVAVHEIGHAMMVQYFSEYFKLQRVTMNANTAGAGGYTLFTPKEFYSEYQTKGFFLVQLIVALGGRAAEIVYFNKTIVRLNDDFDTFGEHDDIYITTGASADIRQANNIAKKYLELFENYIVPESIGDSTRNQIDNRVSELIKKSLDCAVSIIESNYDSFDSLVKRLLKENTIIY
jgi:cell division protease FtsH